MTFKSGKITLNSTQREIASESEIKAGKHGHFDLQLIEDTHFKSYAVQVTVELQFDFKAGINEADALAKPHRWTESEKAAFMREFVRVIPKTWNKMSIGKLSNGRNCSFSVHLIVSDSSFTFGEHYHVRVEKRVPGSPSKSTVGRSRGYDAHLDSLDNSPKSGGQIPSVHEFGHMLGLADEYKKGHAHKCDKTSIMNGSKGTLVRARHLSYFRDWADRQLSALKRAA